MEQIDSKELDEYLYKLKSEINNFRLINDKLSIRVNDIENENINLKLQISKLAIENSTLEFHIKTKTKISNIVYNNYRDIITKLENIDSQ